MLRRHHPRRCLALGIAVGLVWLVPACARRPNSPAGHNPITPSAGRPGSSEKSPSAADANATVVKVVDGDTIRARIGGVEESVRLIGVDTPETSDPRKPVQCFGQEAANRTKELLPPGTPLRLLRDAELRDHYGRVLAYVYRARDGLFVNLVLVEEGFASSLTYPPNLAHSDEFAATAAAARDAGRGLWGRCRQAGVPIGQAPPAA